MNLAPVAQWTEHQPSKLLVVSSNLTGGAIWDIYMEEECLSEKGLSSFAVKV